MSATDPRFEHDACGVGLVADLGGRSRDRVLPLALGALARLEHRGGLDADGRSGDGAGVVLEIPWAAIGSGLAGDPEAGRGLGMLFVERGRADAAHSLVEGQAAATGVRVVGWRSVPVKVEALGETAARTRPEIWQAALESQAGETAGSFERRLLRLELAIAEQSARDGLAVEVVSLDTRTVVYKGLLRAADLPAFYPDLADPRCATSFALVHRRFSTNTRPSWPAAQPFERLAHNGEINTIDGNRAWMRARWPQLAALGLPAGHLERSFSGRVSDSKSLDAALGLLLASGHALHEALALLLPPAWEHDAELPPDVRAFFEWGARRCEPWDGPALVVATDGRRVAAALDRNGLRPARYVVTSDGLLALASEAGAFDLPDERIVEVGRLGPGEAVLADPPAGRFHDATGVRLLLGRLGRKGGGAVPAPRVASEPEMPQRDETARRRLLRAFGYTREELQFVLGPMHQAGTEPIGSMGDDTPLAVLSRHGRSLSSYFRQRFAQVTNPPIDPLRERNVMSARVVLGPQPSLFERRAPTPLGVELESPIVEPKALAGLLAGPAAALVPRRLSVLADATDGVAGLEQAVARLRSDAVLAVREGSGLLVLSDEGVGPGRVALPMLLAVSSVHQQLVAAGLRTRTSLLAHTADARDDHQLALLLAFGASAVSPWLALEAVAAAAPAAGSEALRHVARYRGALEKGLLKILSKLGISTVRSYVGSQLFEALGLDPELVQAHFGGTVHALSGTGFARLATEALERHAAAYSPVPAPALEEGSLHRFRRGGEAHAYAPEVVKALRAAARDGVRSSHRHYARLVESRPPLALRDLLKLREVAPPLPLGEVEPSASLARRFVCSAMSLGALSPEAHRTLAIAMNRLGARSNSGEGGEPPEGFWRALPGGDSANSRVKQVASARFGVDAEYLAAADELQIKIAQGSKPGEGGQLPGHKVVGIVARLRRATPGTALISPPPHHDVYSIEDLAGLVHELKRVNPRAPVSVKLVSTAGIGTIAAGVAKAWADAIVIGGHDGGTGASPLGSIKQAGTPWELGLAEAQRALVETGLRGRVRLQVEGGLKTGRDVVIAALLGADEYGFGSAALVAAGCVMARQCHLNTCPAGIATQREDLRGRFQGRPEEIVRFFLGIAHEVRETLAALGARSLGEIVGRSDLLEARPQVDLPSGPIALDALLTGGAFPGAYLGQRNDAPQSPGIDEAVIERLPARAVSPSIELSLPVRNADRAVGARLAGELARRRAGGPAGDGVVRLRFSGSAGQSFGAFAVRGMELLLEGEANDGLGKGLSGGLLVVRPGRASRLGEAPLLAGNAALYGATAGEAYVAGSVGERFAVRLSGARAVVEGAGDHACEYLTDGVVVVLGSIGRNFGAGMSGGLAYVLDPEHRLEARLNPDLVRLDDALGPDDARLLRAAVERHAALTGSRRAARLLGDWPAALRALRAVRPKGSEAGVPDWIPEAGAAGRAARA
ncbi:MAG: glutamate synthase large subunit [Vicinamibacteria bacterium]